MCWQLYEIMAAWHWRMLPWEFSELQPERKALVMASFVVEREIKHYLDSEQARAMDHMSKGGISRSTPKWAGRR